ncbi:helicase HerA-like domain-containing protein [Schaalia sp. Marseille-Q2122]|uniref:helicase HerA-like domain-containing protein n=1 Tax=Schaalia sp. Marseille-Q2122 TaxID=2736604 RepID=UPI001589EB1F|nr:helicase HerA-like domain-containing protein [Schaalia sp. Marseille-Q2122]
MSEHVDALRDQLAAAEAQAQAARAALEEAERIAAEARRAQEAAEEAARVAAEAQEKAAQARAAAEAANATPTGASSDGTPSADTAPASPTPDTTTGGATGSELSAFAAAVAPDYSFTDPAVTIGTLIDEGTHIPAVTAKIPLAMFNRHLLVAGATGSGKTRTLQLLTEGLSAAGSSVLLCDVKGDLTGLAEAGTASEKLLARTQNNGQAWAGDTFPIELLSLGGADAQFPGATVRTRISDFGPILLSRALSLNTTQEQSLQLIFLWADKQGLDLVDLSDLRAVITFLTSDEGKEELDGIGGVSKATAGVILRTLSTLEAQGGADFFGEPAFDTTDLMRTVNGRGIISLLGVGDIGQRPNLISAVIMWLLANLFSDLPEVGDVDAPKLVFFFDEAHLLFADATKEFIRQVVQTVRLIRSKGVGVVFVTQTPKDIPADVLAQLGSRVQHVLRAVTPDDHKKLRQTVETFPATELDLAEVLTNLGTGEAIVSVLSPKGRPTAVVPVSIWAPASVMGPAASATISSINASSSLVARYSSAINPFSAEEALTQRSADYEAEQERLRRLKEAEAIAAKEAKAREAALEREIREAEKQRERELREAQKRAEKEEAARQKAAQQRMSTVEKALGSMLRSAGSQLGREISRTIFGTRRR